MTTRCPDCDEPVIEAQLYGQTAMILVQPGASLDGGLALSGTPSAQVATRLNAHQRALALAEGVSLYLAHAPACRARQTTAWQPLRRAAA